MIDGVHFKVLRLIPDQRGWLMEILREDDPLFTRFGQVYATAVYPGVVKAWHRHGKQTDRVACVAGNVRLVLCDGREDLPIEVHHIGLLNPMLVVIPPGVWHGWQAVGGETAVVVNVPDLPYDHDEPDEERLPAHTDAIPYDWGKVDG